MYGTENKKLIIEIHDFLADTAHGNKGVKSYIKEMEKHNGESRLYETNFPGYANRYDGEGDRILYNPQKKTI